VPETTNHKYAERPTVRLVELDGSREYESGELENSLKAALQEDAGEAGAEPGEEAEDDKREPPVRLVGAATLRRWHGEVAELSEDGELDRSRALVQIARMLAYAGATQLTIVEALRERDVALGWNKYSTRRDGGARHTPTSLATSVRPAKLGPSQAPRTRRKAGETPTKDSKRKTQRRSSRLRRRAKWRR